MHKIIKKNTFLFLAFAFFFLSLNSQNLLANGNLETSGGYLSNYSLVTPSGNSNSGDYAITTNSQPMNTANFVSSTDHSGTGKMMVVDGRNSDIFWKQNPNIALQGGSTYLFTYYIKNINISTANQPRILFTPADQCDAACGTSVTLVDGNSDVGLMPAGWQKVSYRFTPTAPGTRYIRIELSTIGAGLAGNDFAIDDVSLTLVPPCPTTAPTVSTPLYLCQGSTASPLTATPDTGNTLVWYTTATGGVPSVIAPTPSTTTNGTTTYYVSQSNGVCEGPRAAINVIVNFSNPNFNYNTFCGVPTQPNGVYFDWNNLPGPPIYHISYSIGGGPSVSVQTNISHYEVINPTNQNVTLIIEFAEGYPCVPSSSHTCCATSITPAFASIPASLCYGTAAPILPATSDNGITGTWSPSTVDNTASGNYVFTPASTFPCAAPITKSITISGPNAGTLSGNQTVCAGGTTTFSSTSPGGTWVSSNLTIATINSTTGIITGIAPGTAIITYSVAGSPPCSNATKIRQVTVIAGPNPGTLNGNQALCIGANTTFGSSIPGGTWTSSNTAVATVNSITGNVIGIAAGTSDVTYTVSSPNGCLGTAIRTVTVTAPPNAGILSGAQTICAGQTVTFLSTVPGGTWSSSNTAIATVNSSTGVITAVASGAIPATITYTVTGTGGCANATATRTITVTAAPSAGTLSGNQNVCVGLGSTFFSTVSGGTWSSLSPVIASVNTTTGVVTGVAPGVTTITYTTIGSGGCGNATATRNITVTAAPNAGTLSGTANLCLGATSLITTTGSGGNWSSSNPTKVTISNTGTVTAIAPGTATISYMVVGTGGCSNVTASIAITVTAPPNAGTLSGNQNICEQTSTTFSSSVPGGIWSSNNNSVATVNAAGLVSGISPGTAVINYTATGTGGCADDVIGRAITIIARQVPTFNSITPICEGTPLAPLPTTSINGFTGTWSPALNNTLTTTYTFLPNATSCATTATLTIAVRPKLTPVFSLIPIQCVNDPAVPVLPMVSQNGVSGTWTPSVVSLATAGTQTYTFHPNATECVTSIPVTLDVTVAPHIVPNFPQIAPFCSGKANVPTLDSTSPNGVEGTWIPAVISNTASGSYTFTPNTIVNQCAEPQILHVTVIQKTQPDFPQVPFFCVNTTAPILSNVSPNGVNGTWSPAIVDNTVIGTSNYLFTPNAGECALPQTLAITVTPGIVPDFTDIAVCKTATPPVLNPTSPNGVFGTWTPPAIDMSLVGTNPYLFTPLPGVCGVPKTINVTVNEYRLNNVEGIVSNYFEDLQVITVIASNSGDYLYQLDYGSLQESNVFTDVPAGLHTITVVDKNNCGPSLSDPNIMVINYPKFFTPNSDNYNDTWNIKGLESQANSMIHIFDRYGKFIKQISPSGDGWDGTYNGYELPSSDYWFTIDYQENGVSKQFKSHFSLKR